MKEKREIPKLKNIKKLFFLIPFSYSTILPLRWYCSYMSKKKFNILAYGLLVVGVFWACMPNVPYMWRMESPLQMLLY